MSGHVPIEETEVCRIFVELADWVWNHVIQWDDFAKDTLGKQLVRAADSISANLIEGDGRFGKADAIHFMVIARGSARETRHWLIRAYKRCLLDSQETEEQIRILESATRQLNGLITYRRNAVVKEESTEYSVEF